MKKYILLLFLFLLNFKIINIYSVEYLNLEKVLENYKKGLIELTGNDYKIKSFEIKHHEGEVGDKVYLTSEQSIVFIGWYNDNDKENKYLTSSGERISTLGNKFGFYAMTKKDKKYWIYCNLNPNSQVAKDLIHLITLGKAAGVEEIKLPTGVQIGEIGNSGYKEISGIILIEFEIY